MGGRVLVIDSGRRPAIPWKARLAPLDCLIAGPFSSPSRVKPKEVGPIDLVFIDGAALARGGIELLGKLKEQTDIGTPLLLSTAAAEDVKQRELAAHAGADEVLAEPIDLGLLTL